ncbi:MAG: flagellar motor protein MotB [Micavibrio sp.]
MASKKSDKQDELRPVVIKKIKRGGGGHHGGAWKVAYADFVTAMMAFFLLLWLLNVTTKEQKEGIAQFFDPNPRITLSEGGASGMLGGLSIAKEGAMVTELQEMAPRQETAPALRPGENDVTEEQLREELRRREEENFKKAEAAIHEAMKDNPELRQLSQHLQIDMTPEGLRIQIVDRDGRPMFPSGSAQMYVRTQTLLQNLADVIKKMPNEISVRGHTDAVPYSKGATYGNWELSADRANASRRVLTAAGVPDDKINNVLGKADKDHLVPDKPTDAQNRRISIILLRQELVTQVGANMSTKAVQEEERAKRDPLYRRSSGTVSFP